jgi:hypothetical protein
VISFPSTTFRILGLKARGLPPTGCIVRSITWPSMRLPLASTRNGFQPWYSFNSVSADHTAPAGASMAISARIDAHPANSRTSIHIATLVVAKTELDASTASRNGDQTGRNLTTVSAREPYSPALSWLPHPFLQASITLQIESQTVRRTR